MEIGDEALVTGDVKALPWVIQTAKVVVAKRTLVVVERERFRRRFRPDSPHVEQFDSCLMLPSNFVLLLYMYKCVALCLGILPCVSRSSSCRNQESSTLTCVVVMSSLADSVSWRFPASRFTRGLVLVAANWGNPCLT